MIAALALALAAASSPPHAPTPSACAAQVRRADPARVAPGCWRVGPLTIGMARVEARRRIGDPDAAYEIDGALAGGPTRLHDEVYVFPRDLAQRLAARPVAAVDFKLLELTYDEDRLVRISNAPGAKVSSPHCGHAALSTRAVSLQPRAFAPFEQFAGVRVGEPMAQVRRALGSRSSTNRPGDFINYWPLPLTLATYDTRRLSGFAVAETEGMSIQGAAASIDLDLDPVTCRTRGFHVRAAPRA